MKYSKSVLRACFPFLIFFPLLTACGGGGGSVVRNSQSTINTGQDVSGQGLLDCQPIPGTPDVCAQAPGSSQGGDTASNGITADNAAQVANSILGVITDAFDLGGVNGVADSLVTATQVSYQPTGFDLVSFALQQLIQLDTARQQNLLGPVHVTGLLDNQLHVVCSSGSYTQDNAANPGSVIVTFPATDPCTFSGITYSGQLTISDYTVTDQSNFAARFTFNTLTIEVDGNIIELTGSMNFSSISGDGLFGTGQIISVSDSQSNSGGSLGITVDGETNTLTNFTINYSFDLAANTNSLSINNGSISSSIPGSPFSITTLNALQKFPSSGSFGTTPGPFAGGSLKITSSDGSELILTITGTFSDVQLQVDSVDLTPVSWAELLNS